MAHKKKTTLGKYLLRVLMVIPTIIQLFGNLLALINLEAREAGNSITKLILLAVICGVIIMSTWLCVLGLFATYLVSIHYSYLFAFSILVVTNIVILLLLVILMQQTSKPLFFPKTRLHIKSSLGMSDE